MRWLNRNVSGIGIADLAADANYEMILSVLPLFITAGLGAPVIAVGLVEGVADGSSALVKVWSGWYSDRISWRKKLRLECRRVVTRDTRVPSSPDLSRATKDGPRGQVKLPDHQRKQARRRERLRFPELNNH